MKVYKGVVALLVAVMILNKMPFSERTEASVVVKGKSGEIFVTQNEDEWKKQPEVPKVSILRQENDNGSGNWYSAYPEITLEAISDEGSTVKCYYRLYCDSATEYKVYKEGEKLTVTQDGMYILETYSEDETGNKSKVSYHSIYVDTAKPEITKIIFSDEKGKELQAKDVLEYPIITNKKIVVTVEAEDALSGVEKIAIEGVDNENLPLTTIDGKGIQLTLTPNYIGKIMFYAVDRLGNQSDVIISVPIIEEIQKPEIEIKADEKLTKWQKNDIYFNITVQDYDAGIQKIKYLINGEVVDKVDFSETKALQKEHKLYWLMTESSKKATGDILTVIAYDNAGNEKEKSKTFYIDQMKPEIEFSGEIKDNAFYNTEQELILNIKENMYEDATVNIEISRFLDGEKKSIIMEQMELEEVESSKKISFTLDGNYEVVAQVIDKAGNKSPKIRKKFTIDKTIPKVSISGVMNKYYSDNVNLFLNVMESNYKSNQITMQVIQEKNQKVVKKEVLHYKTKKKNGEIKHIFTEEGDYKVIVTSMDKAGNQSESKTVKFSIDKTAPKISLNGALPYEISKNVVRILGQIKEENAEKNIANITITRQNQNGFIEKIMSKQLPFHRNIISFENSIKEDGKYQVVLTSKDKAQNSTTKELNFTIDNKSPKVVSLKAYDGKYLNHFQWNRLEADIVQDLTTTDTRVYLNGIEQEGTFEVEEEGKYKLEIISKDELENTTKKTAEFIIDKTNPVINVAIKKQNNEMISVSEEKEVYEQGRIYFTLEDTQDWLAKCIVNGKPMSLDEKSNQFQFEINKKGSYEFYIQAIDLAGNKQVLQTTVSYVDKTNQTDETEGKTALEEQKENTQDGNYKIMVIMIVVIVFGSFWLYRKQKSNRKG